MIFSVIGFVLIVLYGGLLFYYTYWWHKIPLYYPAKVNQPNTTISVIVPVRNEEQNIGNLLTALDAQTYPQHLFEVTVVDDHSTDATAEIVVARGGKCRLITLPDSVFSKKKAMEAGVQGASGELIITTDADCLPGKNWLYTMVILYQEKKAVFIAAPVRFAPQSNLLGIFQTLDFITLQGITAASVASGFHSMCNGANLAYTKHAFEEVNGFAGIDAVASGDDLLLMHKIWKRHPQQVYYLKSREAVVQTAPMPTWKEFFWQRIRWASKTTYYDDKRIFWALLLVYIFNLFFVVLLIAGFWNTDYWIVALSYWIVKTIIEVPFVYSVARFFGQQKLVNFFFFLQPLHILYTVSIGLISQFGSYQWKGRRTK